MRVTYGLLKEHVEAIEKGLEDVDPESNPLIDPRSVRFQTQAYYTLETPKRY